MGPSSWLARARRAWYVQATCCRQARFRVHHSGFGLCAGRWKKIGDPRVERTPGLVEASRGNVERQLGMGTRLFVGNLAYSTMDHQLEAAFAEHGQVLNASVVVDRTTGRSRGFGFVEFENENDAKAAIEALDGSTLDGRPIAVNEARPRAPKRDDWSGGGGGGGSGGGQDRGRGGGSKRGRGGGGRRGGW